MDVGALKAKAAAFRKLHDGPDLLVLPNAWDVASARIFEDAGFPAIATTSAGIAYAHGYPDQERISRPEMARAVQRIAASLRVPLTADMESGYGDVAETVRAAIDAGAVGMNLEDATRDAAKPLFDLEVQVERIRAARAASDAAGVRLVINARTDVFLAAVGPEEGRMDDAIRRANAYRDAGADCLFVPGVADAARIAALAKAIRGPLNILAGPGVPSAPELRKLGVARLSVGSGAMRAVLGLTRRIAQELRGPGTYGAVLEGAVSYAEMNQLLSRPHA